MLFINQFKTTVLDGRRWPALAVLALYWISARFETDFLFISYRIFISHKFGSCWWWMWWWVVPRTICFVGACAGGTRLLWLGPRGASRSNLSLWSTSSVKLQFYNKLNSRYHFGGFWSSMQWQWCAGTSGLKKHSVKKDSKLIIVSVSEEELFGASTADRVGGHRCSTFCSRGAHFFCWSLILFIFQLILLLSIYNDFWDSKTTKAVRCQMNRD